MRAAPVEVTEVSKSFGDITVLRNLSIRVEAGECVSIIGPSGSGKTTILRLIAMLEAPDSGQVYVNGTPLSYAARSGRLSREQRRRNKSAMSAVGMVFQSYNLFPHMTVSDNMTEAPRSVLGLSSPDAEMRCRELLALVGLSDKWKSFPHELSGGQQQRVAIARALAMRPKILLFDEITSALDPELKGEVLKVIRDLACSGDLSILVVTHEMGFARDVSDRVLMFDHGEVIEDAAPGDLFGNPQKPRTQAFLDALREGDLDVR